MEIGSVASIHNPVSVQHSIFREWWKFGVHWESGKYMIESLGEQKILSVLLGLRYDLRIETALLEDNTYNSPRSQCIRHLYSTHKDNTTYLMLMAERLQTRILPVLGARHFTSSKANDRLLTQSEAALAYPNK